MRHLPIPEQGRWLRLVLNGFFAYYAVPTNFRALNSFYWHVMRLLAARPSPAQPAAPADLSEDDAARGPLVAQPELRHPCPDWRFAVMTRGRSPVRECRTPGSVRGAASNGRPYRDVWDFNGLV